MTNIRNNNYLSLYISSKYHFKFQIKVFKLEIEMKSLKSQALTSINKNFFKKLQFSKLKKNLLIKNFYILLNIIFYNRMR